MTGLHSACLLAPVKSVVWSAGQAVHTVVESAALCPLLSDQVPRGHGVQPGLTAVGSVL